MAIQFHPKPGAIVMAQFPDDFLHGEMEKRRPIIVISTKAEARRQRCATVVPLSLTAPRLVDAHHIVVPKSDMPNGLRDSLSPCFVGETLLPSQVLTTSDSPRSFADVGNNRPSRLQRTPSGA